MPLVEPIERSVHKRELTGRGLEAMQDAIDFGESRSIIVFERLRAEAADMGPDGSIARIPAGDLIEAIDFMAPLDNGTRSLSGDFDSNSVTLQPTQGNTPTMVIASLECASWFAAPDDIIVGNIRALEVYYAIKHLDYISNYKPVSEAADDCGMNM